jgi:hypothetical protein
MIDEPHLLAWGDRGFRYAQTLGMAVLLFGAVLACTGCAGVASLAADLETRHVQSCIYTSGAYGLFASASILTATGGATLEECQRLR